MGCTQVSVVKAETDILKLLLQHLRYSGWNDKEVGGDNGNFARPVGDHHRAHEDRIVDSRVRLCLALSVTGGRQGTVRSDAGFSISHGKSTRAVTKVGFKVTNFLQHLLTDRKLPRRRPVHRGDRDHDK